VNAVSQWDRLQPGRRRFDRHQICSVTRDAFPAKASPTRGMRSVSGTGFSREEACANTLNFAA